jgi:hypothetical protein
MEVACSSKTLVSTQKTIKCHSSDGHNLNYIWVQTASEFCISFLSPEVVQSKPKRLTAYVIKEQENITRKKSGRSCYIHMKFILIMAVPEKGRESKHKHSLHSDQSGTHSPIFHFLIFFSLQIYHFILIPGFCFIYHKHNKTPEKQ